MRQDFLPQPFGVLALWHVAAGSRSTLQGCCDVSYRAPKVPDNYFHKASPLALHFFAFYIVAYTCLLPLIDDINLDPTIASS